MEIVHRLHQSDGTSTSDSKSIGTCVGIGIGGSIGIVTGTSICSGVGAQHMDYCLTMDGLVRCHDKIYVPDSSDLMKVILREFVVKPYSGHPGYQKTLIVVRRF